MRHVMCECDCSVNTKAPHVDRQPTIARVCANAYYFASLLCVRVCRPTTTGCQPSAAASQSNDSPPFNRFSPPPFEWNTKVCSCACVCVCALTSRRSLFQINIILPRRRRLYCVVCSRARSPDGHDDFRVRSCDMS